MPITYNQDNSVPFSGGVCTKYWKHEEHKRRRLIFLNGICNSPRDHSNACNRLSELTSCEVTGIYNQTGIGVCTDKQELKWTETLKNAAFDIAQSATDWTAVSLRGLGMDTPLLNGCANSLYKLLWEDGFLWPNWPIVIVAHSQGNLITSNALMHFSKQVRKRGVAWPPRIQVFAVASPAVSWPTNDFIQVKTYRHSLDLVAWLSLGRNVCGEREGNGKQTAFSFSHTFESYQKDSLLNDIRQTLGTSK